MNALLLEAAKAAITHMLSGGHFDICTIDSILKMTGGIPPKREYSILRTLHCVSYSEMSPRLRLELPRIMQIVLESEPIRFELVDPSTQKQLSN